ncbi:hypothetical protein, partial [Bacillus altitudinis]|uniref:hypothetical protein n=1 Tax=Bacillus altitudinis TaxID=293387 RepID=UPI002F91D129
NSINDSKHGLIHESEIRNVVEEGPKGEILHPSTNSTTQQSASGEPISYLGIVVDYHKSVHEVFQDAIFAVAKEYGSKHNWDRHDLYP